MIHSLLDGHTHVVQSENGQAKKAILDMGGSTGHWSGENLNYWFSNTKPIRINDLGTLKVERLLPSDSNTIDN
jgi:hypothetical protein